MKVKFIRFQCVRARELQIFKGGRSVRAMKGVYEDHQKGAYEDPFLHFKEGSSGGSEARAAYNVVLAPPQ